jgi:DNA-binding NtrC family response regulator
VQLIACGQRPSDRTELVSAPIEIPALSSRRDEIDRLIQEYARDAGAAMRLAAPMSTVDHDWVRKHSGTSLVEIEKGAFRVAALRETGSIAGAAALLGMAHASLGEWIGRRRLPAGALAPLRKGLR